MRCPTVLLVHYEFSDGLEMGHMFKSIFCSTELLSMWLPHRFDVVVILWIIVLYESKLWFLEPWCFFLHCNESPPFAPALSLQCLDMIVPGIPASIVTQTHKIWLLPASCLICYRAELARECKKKEKKKKKKKEKKKIPARVHNAAMILHCEGEGAISV